MKKIITILTVITISIVLTGCKQKEETTTLTVLTSSGYEPYEMYDVNGELTGFDIELMELLALELGYTVVWKDVDFNGIIASLQLGTDEVAIAAITPTETRKESVDFSKVYYSETNGLENYMVFSNQTNISNLDDLQGKVVGVQLGTIQEELATKLSSEYGFTVSALNSPSQVIQEMKLGNVDVLFVENLVAGSIIESNPDFSKLLIEANLDDVYGMAIAFSKGSSLVEEFNQALETVTDNGELQKLIDKYLSE